MKSVEKVEELEDLQNALKSFKIGCYILLLFAIIFTGITLFSSTDNTCNPCDYITSTPSWLIDGKLVGSGYVPNMTTEAMIEGEITFVYREGCGWCEKQKENLDMEVLNMRGLTLKC